jgi:indole-3-glycerol phosphate synthase
MSSLNAIFDHKREEVARARATCSLEDVRAQARDADAPRGFLRALRQRTHPLGLIAEVKKASPSRGVIRPDFDPAAIARAYETAGADALSVLTDERFFQGSPQNLQIAKGVTRLPCLRKDFLYDPYQVYEARAWGADAVLLIVAGLDSSALSELHALAKDLGMDVLIEVHTEAEAEVALELGAELVGVNNRNLSDFSTSLSTSERIIPLLREGSDRLVVSESALETYSDLERVRAAGAEAVLIGTTFCAAPDVGSKVREVMGW